MAVASQHKVPGFDPWLGQSLSMRSLLVLPVPPSVSSGFSSFIIQSKDMQVKLIGYSKLSVGVNVSIQVAYLYMSPLRLTGAGVSRFSPKMLAQAPAVTLHRISGRR